MATYTADLTGAHSALIAHLKPGDVIEVTTSLGARRHTCDSDEPAWLALYDDDPCYRSALFGSGAKLAQNTLVKDREHVNRAVRAIRPGGAAYIVREHRQRTDYQGWPYGPAVPIPVAFELIAPNGTQKNA